MASSRLFKATRTDTGPRSVTYTVQPTWRLKVIVAVLRALTGAACAANWTIERLRSWPVR